VVETAAPFRNRTVNFRYEDGRTFSVTTDADSRAVLSREVDGKVLIMEPFARSAAEWPAQPLRMLVITGNPLTLLDVVCLAMAVPVHVAHIAITTLRGNTRTFADDNRNLAAQLRAAAFGRPLRLNRQLGDEPVDDKEGLPQPRPNPMNTDSEAFLIVLRGISIAAGLASDTLFARAIGAGGFSGSTAGMSQLRGLTKILKGGTGIAASYVQTFKSVPAFEDRLNSGLHPKDWDKVKPPAGAAEGIFVVLALGDTITFAGGLKHLLCPPASVAPVNGVIPPDWLDKKECNVAIGMGFGCIGLIGVPHLFPSGPDARVDRGGSARQAG
jgi:hypothetical protein